MTVKELIEALSDFPPDMEVWLADYVQIPLEDVRPSTEFDNVVELV